MPKGGFQPGGGRPKGSKSSAVLEAIEKAKTSGELPLEYMLRVMRDKTVDHKRRDYMASAAAPFLHPKLSNVEVGQDADKPFKMVIEWSKPKE